MSRTIEDIGRAFKDLVRQEQKLVIPAQVKSVDEQNFVCSVEMDGIEIENVRLTAVIDDNGNKSAIIPSAGSWVMIMPVYGNDSDYVVVAYSQIDKISVQTGDVKITSDSQGVKVENGQSTLQVQSGEINITSGKVEIKGLESLKTILDDLITQITMITVPTGVGPSGVPINSAAFTAIKTRLNNVLK